MGLYKNCKPEEFAKIIKKLPAELAAFLSLYSMQEYEDMFLQGAKFYLAENSLSGFIVKPNGELISVFSLEKGRGRELVAASVAAGASKLDCLGDHLKDLYGQYGFQVVEQATWNPEFAPKNWNYSKFGTPNWYLMER